MQSFCDCGVLAGGRSGSSTAFTPDPLTFDYWGALIPLFLKVVYLLQIHQSWGKVVFLILKQMHVAVIPFCYLCT